MVLMCMKKRVLAPLMLFLHLLVPYITLPVEFILSLHYINIMTTTFITPHFKWSEALCTDTGLPNLPSDYARANLVSTFRILERVRVFCGFPLKINSGFRTKDVHYEIYRRQNKFPIKHSYHLEGRAVDISISNLSEKQFNKLYNNLLTWSPVEIYYTKSFIHVAF